MATKTLTTVQPEEEASRFPVRETVTRAPCHIEADLHYFKNAADGELATIGDINSNDPKYLHGPGA